MVRNLTNEQLVTRIREGGDGVCYALEQLWNQNQGLIQIYVKKYQGMAECDDLTQEAYIALCDAVDNYKPNLTNGDQKELTIYLLGIESNGQVIVYPAGN